MNTIAKQDIRFIDLFAGIGGMRLGFESVGARCVFTSEWDQHSQKTYAANFGDKPHGDITKILPDEIPDFDILLGGFPCQPFSTIGLREGFAHKTQGTLFFDIARILESKRPLSFLLENVEGLVNHENGQTMATILEVLDSLGYWVYYKVLDAADYQVPQYRCRIYFVGVRKDAFNFKPAFSFPSPNPERATIGQFVEENISGYEISEHLQKVYLFKKDDGRPQLIDKNSNIQVKTLVATYHKIQRLTGTFVKDGPTGMRLLTENECKAIMGFPKDFKVPVSRTQMYRQFGNSVAVPVIKAIAAQMHQAFFVSPQAHSNELPQIATNKNTAASNTTHKKNDLSEKQALIFASTAQNEQIQGEQIAEKPSRKTEKSAGKPTEKSSKKSSLSDAQNSLF